METSLCLIFPTIWPAEKLKSWFDHRVSVQLHVFHHKWTPGQSFPGIILVVADLPLSLSVQSGSLEDARNGTLNPSKHTVPPVLYTLRSPRALQLLLSLDFTPGGRQYSECWYDWLRTIPTLVCVLHGQLEMSPFHCPGSMCAVSSPSSPRQHFLPSKGGQCQKCPMETLTPLKVALGSGPSGLSWGTYEIMKPQWGGTFYFYEDPITKPDPAIISGKRTLLSFQL